MEFEKKDKIYKLLSKIYNTIENKELAKKILEPNLRSDAINSLKNELTGIYRKNNDY